MSKMIQIRDVDDSLHRVLKSRAAQAGISLSDYLKQELTEIAERPTMREWLAQVRGDAPIETKKRAAVVIREMRDRR